MFGQKAASKSNEELCLAGAQLLEKNSEADLSRLNKVMKVTPDPSWCDPKFIRPSVPAPASSDLNDEST